MFFALLAPGCKLSSNADSTLSVLGRDRHAFRAGEVGGGDLLMGFTGLTILCKTFNDLVGLKVVEPSGSWTRANGTSEAATTRSRSAASVTTLFIGKATTKASLL